MRYKKTPQDKRGTYKYFDEKGNVVAEFIPGKDGVTELDILNLHKIDDHEVYINSKEIKLPKECKPMYEKQKAEFIESFIAEYGRKPDKDEIPKAH